MTLRRSISAFLLSLVSLYSCTPAPLAPIGASSKSFQAEDDEKKLWQDSQEINRALEKANLVYQDRDLEQYLNRVAARVIGNRLQGTNVSPSVKVVEDSFLNAFTLPDGTIYFHTGLLARMENEA